MDDDLVGLHDDLLRIKDQLTGYSSKLEILPIVGMGGIGKTTLARRVYKDPLIEYHFYIHAWITVSQDYQERDALLNVLKSIAPLTDDVCRESKELLAAWLYRSLKYNRYLIIIDDIWNTETWDAMKKWFPNDNNGSRILMTTRLTEVALYANPNSPPHSMKFLNLQESWRLLHRKVFVSETCPSKLKVTGVQIARNCQGLPLAIIVAAGHLSKVNKTLDNWEKVNKRLGSLTSGTREEILDILSLSYSYLPQHLKTCFLYMGTFPKGKEIPVLKLLRLWCAMGFLPSEPPNGIEDVAEKCLGDLISRNLVQVKSTKFDGTVKTCDMHDLLWDLILREAKKEGSYIFCGGPSHPIISSFYSINNKGVHLRYLIQSSGGGPSHPIISSFYSINNKREHLRYLIRSSGFLPGIISMKELKFFELAGGFFNFRDEIAELVNLRYLRLYTECHVPRSVSKLQNLETLINDHLWAGPILPKEIWKMPRLRNLHVGTCTYMPNPSNENVGGDCPYFLPNLKTLSTISTASFTHEVVLNIPNLKELAIRELGEECIGEHQLFNCLSNLIYLHQLENLKLRCDAKAEEPRQLPDWKNFVPNLKHLTLSGTHLPWQEMNSLSQLPKLEVLKLKKKAFSGPVWKQVYEGFARLKFLLLESLDLLRWEANSIHFPILNCLSVRYCRSLVNIPYGIGEIHTLQFIELDNCGCNAVSSVKEIQEERRNMGNDDLDIRIRDSDWARRTGACEVEMNPVIRKRKRKNLMIDAL